MKAKEFLAQYGGKKILGKRVSVTEVRIPGVGTKKNLKGMIVRLGDYFSSLYIKIDDQKGLPDNTVVEIPRRKIDKIVLI
jgi:hypothetical protein